MSVTLIICLVCIAVLAAFCVWSNESWHRTCLRINDEWLERMNKLIWSVGKELEQMQKKIDELEAKLEDDER